MARRAFYLYTDDQGDEYRVFIPVWLGSFTANPFGFAADDTTKPKLPRYWRMRYVTSKQSGATNQRKTHCGTLTCAAFATMGTNHALPNNDGTTSTYVSQGTVGEKKPAV